MFNFEKKKSKLTKIQDQLKTLNSTLGLNKEETEEYSLGSLWGMPIFSSPSRGVIDELFTRIETLEKNLGVEFVKKECKSNFYKKTKNNNKSK